MAQEPPASPTIHATAVLVGARALVIRGAAGSGKSILALRLIQAGEANAVRFARLVGDDRVHVEARHGRLIVRPAAALVGLLEVRGLGILRLAYEPAAVAAAIVDLASGDAPRLPEADARTAVLAGIVLPRLTLGRGSDSLPTVLSFAKSLQDSPTFAGAPI